MEDGLVPISVKIKSVAMFTVLILVVMEDGLVLVVANLAYLMYSKSLNPCCNGRWSSTDYTA